MLPAVIGRSRDADLTIVHPMISRRHCELVEQDGLVRVRDLGSLNGTFLGERQVEDEPAKPGAYLTVGPMTFEIDYEPATQSVASGSATPGVAIDPPSDLVVSSDTPTGDGSRNNAVRWPNDLETESEPLVAPPSDDPDAGSEKRPADGAPHGGASEGTDQGQADIEETPAVGFSIAPADGALPDFSGMSEQEEPDREEDEDQPAGPKAHDGDGQGRSADLHANAWSDSVPSVGKPQRGSQDGSASGDHSRPVPADDGKEAGEVSEVIGEDGAEQTGKSGWWPFNKGRRG